VEETMIEVHFIVEEDFHGHRLDHYLARKIRRLSRTRIQEVIRTQLALERRGEAPVRLRPSSTVAAGDRLTIRRPARPEPVVPRDFAVLHDDAEVMVIDKPAGLPVHATARYHFNTVTRVLGEKFPGQGLQIAHRLDRETSGLLVFARDEPTKIALQDGWDWVVKHYLAVVQGSMPATGAFRSLLAENRAHNVYSTSDPTVGRPCVTGFRLLREFNGHSLLDLELVTGRKHQIRVHLADDGHPVCGDRRYGGPPHTRLALHAQCLEFPHPATGEPLRFTARPPEGFAGLAGPLGADDLAGWGLGPRD